MFCVLRTIANTYVAFFLSFLFFLSFPPPPSSSTQIAFAIDKQKGGGSTAILEGLVVGQNEYNTRGRAGVRKLVVLITDGTDNCGGCESLKKATEMKEKDGAHIISIGFSTGVDVAMLKKIASIPYSMVNASAGASCNDDDDCPENAMCTETGNCQIKDYYFSPTATQLKEITLRLAVEACPPGPPPTEDWVPGPMKDCIIGGSSATFTRTGAKIRRRVYPKCTLLLCHSVTLYMSPLTNIDELISFLTPAPHH